MTYWIPMRHILINLPEEVIVELEEAANQAMMSRSEFIRHTLEKAVHGKFPKTIDEIMWQDPTRFANLSD